VIFWSKAYSVLVEFSLRDFLANLNFDLQLGSLGSFCLFLKLKARCFQFSGFLCDKFCVLMHHLLNFGSHVKGFKVIHSNISTGNKTGHFIGKINIKQKLRHLIGQTVIMLPLHALPGDQGNDHFKSLDMPEFKFQSCFKRHIFGS
jgi:hypothetical protein